ncbi:MAG: polymer-forming cytoskeletal protein [Blastomonas sp.]
MAGSSTFSVIGTDVLITGNITAEVDLHVDGKVEGDIKCASLVQGQSSRINGGITAQSARLAGTVNGSIDARDLVIEASAHVTGDVSYETITIEQGGHVDGQFKHKSKNAANSQSAPVSAALRDPNAIPGFIQDKPAMPLKAELAP